MATSKLALAAVLLFAGYAAAGPSPFGEPKANGTIQCHVTPDADGRNGIIDKNRRWTNGVVYFHLADGTTQEDWNVIRAGMMDVSKETCIKFEYITNWGQNYIQFQHDNNGGCVSRIGMEGGAQPLNLARRDSQGLTCMTAATVAHEIIHALGFWHEQQRDDRDQYITVLWDNIPREQYDQFNKVDTRQFKAYGAYDLDSVMHYHNTAFTKNGRRTMEARGNPNRQLGNENGLTPTDRLKINRLYECRSSRTTLPMNLEDIKPVMQ